MIQGKYREKASKYSSQTWVHTDLTTYQLVRTAKLSSSQVQYTCYKPRSCKLLT